MEGLNLQDILECDLLRASGEDRSALLKWFLARDVFTGRNFKAQDFERGLALASKSSLPEARLFCRTLRRFEAPFSRKQLRKLLEQQADDPIALCLLGLVFCDPHLLQQAVDRGSVLAHAALSAGSERSFFFFFFFFLFFLHNRNNLFTLIFYLLV